MPLPEGDGGDPVRLREPRTAAVVVLSTAAIVTLFASTARYTYPDARSSPA